MTTKQNKTKQNKKHAEVPERSKGVDLSSTATASWVRIPPSAFFSQLC